MPGQCVEAGIEPQELGLGRPGVNRLLEHVESSIDISERDEHARGIHRRPVGAVSDRQFVGDAARIVATADAGVREAECRLLRRRQPAIPDELLQPGEMLERLVVAPDREQHANQAHARRAHRGVGREHFAEDALGLVVRSRVVPDHAEGRPGLQRCRVEGHGALHLLQRVGKPAPRRQIHGVVLTGLA